MCGAFIAVFYLNIIITVVFLGVPVNSDLAMVYGLIGGQLAVGSEVSIVYGGGCELRAGRLDLCLTGPARATHGKWAIGLLRLFSSVASSPAFIVSSTLG